MVNKMKKSEILELLYKDVDSFLGEQDWSNDNLVNYILDRCEAHGMLPPFRDTIIEGHLCDTNTWEPEYEKK